MPTIKKMVVHNLNLAGDAPIFSNNLINLANLDPDGKAIDFFKKHISNNRTQSSTKQCHFNDSRAAHVKDSVITIAKSSSENEMTENFIEKSKVIADHFANSIRGKSTSDGSVFILKYTYNDTEYIGILKMDPNLGIQVLDDLTLEVHPNMLPGINEKLHKSAFIKLQDKFEDGQTHLFVLDRQQTKDEVAKFFLTDFLQAKEQSNPDNLTVEIEREIKKVIFSQITGPEQKSNFAIALTQKLTSNEEFDLNVDLPSIAKNYIPEDFAMNDSLQTIKDNVLKKFPDATFKFSPSSEKVRPIEYKSQDNNVIIKIENKTNSKLYSYKIDSETGDTILRFSSILQVRPKN